MNLFRISPFLEERSRMEDFLRDCFVSIGYPGIGDLEKSDRAEVSKRLNRVYGYEGNELERRLEDVYTFVRGMDDGDYVLVPSGGSVWLGDLGDYYYRDDYDRPEEATCHRRGVTWLGVLPTAALNPVLRAFVCETSGSDRCSVVERYPLEAEQAGLEAFAAQAPGGRLPGFAAESASESDFRFTESGTGERNDAEFAAVDPGASPVDAETLSEAVAVLREALRGDDLHLRVRAAEALLRYAK